MQQQSNIIGLDVFNLLEILKNEELYTQRLNEIKEAERALEEIRFIAATIADAKQIREQAERIKYEAEVIKTHAEEESADLRSKTKIEVDELRAKFEQEKSVVATQLNEIYKTKQWVREQIERNKLEDERLRQISLKLVSQESAVLGARKDFQNRVAEARELVNKEYSV